MKMEDHKMECFCFEIKGIDGRIRFSIPTDSRKTEATRVSVSEKIRNIIADDKGVSIERISLVCSSNKCNVEKVP